MKNVVLSMDVEDWYHLDYFDRSFCDKSHSMLDGIDKYQELLNNYKIKSTYFVLGELITKELKKKLVELSIEGNEISSHGWDHKRPLSMDINNFKNDLIKSKQIIEDATGDQVYGYRAPCFSMNSNYLQIVENVGYKYDSSLIRFDKHPLYGKIELDDYLQVSSNIYKRNKFLEFEVSTINIFKKNIPISGGGYIRIFPWMIMKNLIKRYLQFNDLYVLYIHPFELSEVDSINYPPNTKIMSKYRFSTGRKKVYKKLDNLIKILIDYGFNFTTFKDLTDKINK